MEKIEQRFTGERQAIVDQLFPGGIPALWCPPLTHFREDGRIDRARMRAHLRFLRPYVRDFLVPGSTGEGWDLSEDEAHDLLEFMAGEIHALGGHLLIGALKPTAADVVRDIQATMTGLARRTGASHVLEILERSGVAGFAVCPPRGASLSQREIGAALEEVLSLKVPTVLYQLPQVTQNEIAPETVASLAARYPTLYLLKDSSGADRVAASGFRALFLLRGAEDGYARHLAGNGGRYDGFLLSTANCFPRQLTALISDVRRGEIRAAEAFSRTLAELFAGLLDRGGKVGYGNPYGNANKALDHFFAYGPGAARIPAPCVHGGRRLPATLVEAAGTALRRHGLMPERGYLPAA